MKRLLSILLAAAVIAVSCDELFVSSDDNSSSQNQGGNHPEDDNTTNLPVVVPGSETVNGVVQPKGAIKHVHKVRVDNRDIRSYDNDYVYIYDSDGRLVLVNRNEKLYNESKKLVFDEYYQDVYAYNGNKYETRNSPDAPYTSGEGELDDEGNLTNFSTMVNGKEYQRYTYTYKDVQGLNGERLSTFEKEYPDGSKKEKTTYYWDRKGNISSLDYEVDGTSTHYEYTYYDSLDPTFGRFRSMADYTFYTPGMLNGPSSVNLVKREDINDNFKATTLRVCRTFEYEWNSDNTVITKLKVMTMVFPCAYELIFQNERYYDTYTFEYYK